MLLRRIAASAVSGCVAAVAGGAPRTARANRATSTRATRREIDCKFMQYRPLVISAILAHSDAESSARNLPLRTRTRRSLAQTKSRRRLPLIPHLIHHILHRIADQFRPARQVQLLFD